MPTTEEGGRKRGDVSAHGLIIGGPLDGVIETDPNFLERGFMKAKAGKWHEYSVYERPDGTNFFLYAGSRRTLNP